MEQPRKLLSFASGAEWRAWLATHHASAPEAWLVHRKKGSKRNLLTLAEGIEEALCFGWVDSLLRSLDAERFTLRYTPRRARSLWSEGNKRRVRMLMRAGRMTSAGLEQVAQAKASGEWAAAAAREDIRVLPADLARELRKHKAAQTSFRRWSPSHKIQYLHWLNSAKRPATRLKRLRAIIAAAEAGK